MSAPVLSVNHPPADPASQPALVGARATGWLVFFGEDWGRHNSTGQYLALALAAARGDRLLWINSLGLRQPRLNRADLARAGAKLVDGVCKRRQSAGSRQAGPPIPHGVELHVAAPLALPFLRHAWVRRLNRWLVGWQLRRVQRRLGLTAPLVVTACPATADVLDVLAPVAKLYYCADEHGELPGMDRVLVDRLERDLLSRVDAVVASSQALATRKRGHHRRVRYLPHAVDGAHFAPAARGELAVPADIARLPGPRIGYVGLIGRHLDLAAIARTAAAMPTASVVLIGPIESGLHGLPQADNIHYLGPRSYAELPACLQAFAVGLLPWNDSPRNRYAHPTKVREYLAAGCPVVASRHPEIVGLGRNVHIATDVSDFARRVVELAALPRRPEDRAAIAAVLADDNWDARARVVQQLVVQQLLVEVD